MVGGKEETGGVSKLASKVTSTLFLMTTISLLSSLSVRPDIKQGDSLIPPNKNQEHIPATKPYIEDKNMTLLTCFKT